MTWLDTSLGQSNSKRQGNFREWDKGNRKSPNYSRPKPGRVLGKHKDCGELEYRNRNEQFGIVRHYKGRGGLIRGANAIHTANTTSATTTMKITRRRLIRRNSP
jgi:hypothetical protein